MFGRLGESPRNGLRRGGRGGGARGTNVSLMNPKGLRIQINYTSSECLECSGGAVKEFCAADSFFFFSFFSAVSCLQLRKDGRQS